MAEVCDDRHSRQASDLASLIGIPLVRNISKLTPLRRMGGKRVTIDNFSQHLERQRE